MTALEMQVNLRVGGEWTCGGDDIGGVVSGVGLSCGWVVSGHKAVGGASAEVLDREVWRCICFGVLHGLPWLMETEVEHLCGDRVLAGMGWVIAVNSSPVTEKQLSSHLLEFPHFIGLEPEWILRRLFPQESWVQSGWQEGGCRVTRGAGLAWEVRVPVPSCGWVHAPNKSLSSPWKGPFSPRKGWKAPGEGVAGLASAEG